MSVYPGGNVEEQGHWVEAPDNMAGQITESE